MTKIDPAEDVRLLVSIIEQLNGPIDWHRAAASAGIASWNAARQRFARIKKDNCHASTATSSTTTAASASVTDTSKNASGKKGSVDVLSAAPKASRVTKKKGSGKRKVKKEVNHDEDESMEEDD